MITLDMQTSSFAPPRFVVMAVALLLCMTSCSSPDAVHQFVTSARDATSEFAPFVKDIAGSCIRRKLADRPVTEIDDAAGTAEAACKEDLGLVPDLLGAMKVLAGYFKALDSLASGEIVSYDKDIDGFADKLQAAARFPAPATDAVKGLAKFLISAATRGYQRKKLSDALTAADGNVTELTNVLGRIIGVEYVRDLDNEADSLKNRYVDAMRSSQHNDAVALLLQRQWRQDLESLQKKKSAAGEYKQALEKIRDGHKQLASAATKWSAPELVRDLGSYTASIQALVTSFRAASF